jgi:hypothetical protein
MMMVFPSRVTPFIGKERMVYTVLDYQGEVYMELLQMLKM